MTYAMSLNQQARQIQNLKQSQLLMMLPQMQQAITILQVPVMEMVQIIEEEMEHNPILEFAEEARVEEELDIEEEFKDVSQVEKEVTFDERDFDVLRRLDEEYRDHFAQTENEYTPRTMEDDKKQTFIENSVTVKETLFGHLMEQIQQTCETEEDKKVAEIIVGNLDERGYLLVPLEEIKALAHSSLEKVKELIQIIQTFDPFGVCASSVQECLLIQLRCLGKEKSLAYQLIEKDYEDLLHNRIPLIQKKRNLTYHEIRQAIESEIAKLDLHPGNWYSQQIVQQIVPDVGIRLEGETFIIEINDEPVPLIRLNSRYLRMLGDDKLSQEAKEYIRTNITSAKWLVKSMSQRNETLIKIVKFLTEKQKKFFLDPEGELVPLTMKEVAGELELHESTIARAVANKYLNSPRGLVALRSFFTNSYMTDLGQDISSQTVRLALKKIIDGENKKNPLSDQVISQRLSEQGISCARRTVAKYRREFNLGNAMQRKKYD